MKSGLTALLFGLLIATLAATGIGLPPPRVGEPLPLRAWRKLGEHPARGGTGLGLLLIALRPGRRRDESCPEAPHGGRIEMGRRSGMMGRSEEDQPVAGPDGPY
jgi:hypothetical protein